MKVVGLYLVRNEVDIIETNVRYHLAGVIDEAIVIDNGSTDGTLERLVVLSRQLPVLVASEPGPYDQSARVTRMARFATRAGADWVLPIHADEFWVGNGAPFRDTLRDAPADANALFVEVVNFVQSREVLTATPRSLLTMRPEAQIGPVERISTMVREDRIAFVEILYASKCVYRASPELVVYDGNHSSEVEGGVDTDGILCLHGPLRARSVFTQKVDQGRRRLEEGVPPLLSWHVKRWWEMARENTLDREWAANSYEDGALVLAGRRRPLVPDDRLREAVAPHVPVDDGAPEEPTPPVGAYLWAMDTVPGTLEERDFWLFVELDRIQRASGLTGCMVELGRADARSAVLLGHLVRPPEERFVIVDADGDDGINQEFATQYARFHAHAPEVRSGASATRGHTPDIDDLIHACRIVHLNSGGADDSVSRDLLTARNLLSPGGVVAVSDAPAAWGVVLAEGLVPLLVSDATIYGVLRPSDAAWADAVTQWAGAQPRVQTSEESLGGWSFLRLWEKPRADVPPDDLVRIPTLEELEERL